MSEPFSAEAAAAPESRLRAFRNLWRLSHDATLAGGGRAVAKAYEGDYEFGVSDAVDRAYRSFAFLTPEYEDIGKTFWRNMDRVMQLGWLPMELCFWTGLLVQCHCVARQALGLRVIDYSKDGSPEFLSLAGQAWNKLQPSAQEPDDPYKMIWMIGNAQLKAVLEDEIKRLREGGEKYQTAGIEAILAAMITAAYAAFEALASDLWVAALNKHGALAHNYVDKNRDKSLTLSDIRGHGFDLSNRMGTVLVQTRRVAFQSFYDVRIAYEQAFRDTLGDVFADVAAIAEAEKVRHLIAHRSGLVDDKFKREMVASANYKDVEVGQQIPFTGPLAAQHIDACSRMGTALFNAVDAWVAQA